MGFAEAPYLNAASEGRFFYITAKTSPAEHTKAPPQPALNPNQHHQHGRDITLSTLSLAQAPPRPADNQSEKEGS
jgi:hypothetical protein